jgi:hypothetical protein
LGSKTNLIQKMSNCEKEKFFLSPKLCFHLVVHCGLDFKYYISNVEWCSDTLILNKLFIRWKMEQMKLHFSSDCWSYETRKKFESFAELSSKYSDGDNLWTFRQFIELKIWKAYFSNFEQTNLLHQINNVYIFNVYKMILAL